MELMSAASWLLWLLLSAAAATLSVWHYRRRETPGRGRLLLALLRGGALALLFLLLFDPELPGAAGSSRGAQVLLDASLSMSLPGADAGTRWDRARTVARSRAGERPVLLFGDAVRPVAAAALPDSAPGDPRSRLLPALQAAAEGGARSVVVITDGGLEDADAVTRWASRLGLEIETVAVGPGDVANRAIVEVSAPQWIDAAQPVPIEIAVSGAGVDSVPVAVRRDGRVLGRVVLAPAAAGRLTTGQVELRVEPPPGGGWVRLEVALETTDAVSDDDVRTVYVQVGEEPAGIVLVSFQPDWEPRFLAPVLGSALGLPLRGWLRSATGRYLRLGSGLEAGAPGTEADVRRALGRAQLVVLHGLGAAAPEWAHEVARSSRHVLIFPADDAPALPLTVGSALAGDFFPSATLPASPLAPLLTDLEVTGATPLTSLRPAELPSGAWAPLLATRGRQGAALPLVAAGQSGTRRWAVALGSGYWVWAFRGGAERQLYTRLWSAIGGWLAQERDIAALPPVRPATLAAPRGSPLPWVAPGVAADSIRVAITDEGGAVAADTTLISSGLDTLYSSAPAPGHYSYRAAAFAADNVIAADGVFTIERYSPELARSPVDLSGLQTRAATVRGGEQIRRGRPLHASALPYVLLVALLAAEWILRRRWGLR
jgi:hypothetical protein